MGSSRTPPGAINTNAGPGPNSNDSSDESDSSSSSSDSSDLSDEESESDTDHHDHGGASDSETSSSNSGCSSSSSGVTKTYTRSWSRSLNTSRMIAPQSQTSAIFNNNSSINNGLGGSVSPTSIPRSPQAQQCQVEIQNQQPQKISQSTSTSTGSSSPQKTNSKRLSVYRLWRQVKAERRQLLRNPNRIQPELRGANHAFKTALLDAQITARILCKYAETHGMDL